MAEKQIIKVSEGGQRLDIYLAEYFDGMHTRSQITNSIKSGKTTLNGLTVKSGTILKNGDIVEAVFEPIETSAKPEDIKIDVVFEDEYLMIINKPRGLVVHPGAANKNGTLLNGLLMRIMKDGAVNKNSLENEIENQGGVLLQRAGIVHRLDKNTAGLMVAAKTAAAQAKLAAMFEKHEIKRTYIGLVEGVLQGEGVIDKNIIRDPNHRTLFKTISCGGRRAITHYKVLRNFSKWTLVQFNLETGRTHQIRVHCKSIGHALVGDPEYNPGSSIKVEGQMLESVEISFMHPMTFALIQFRIEPSELFLEIIKKIS